MSKHAEKKFGKGAAKDHEYEELWRGITFVGCADYRMREHVHIIIIRFWSSLLVKAAGNTPAGPGR